MLKNTRVEGPGLENLVEMHQLHELWLSNSSVTDAGLQHLQGLTNVSMLVLAGTDIS